MPYKKRSSSRKRLGIMKKAGIAVLIVMPIVLASLFIRLFVQSEESISLDAPVKMNQASLTGSSDVVNVKISQQQLDDDDDWMEIEDASSEVNGEWRGVCAKNSIHSAEDFQRTVQGDAVLSRHFSGFNWENVKIGKQDEEISAYVTHRKGDVIKETSKPIRLPKGDGYITDGVRVVRTFCCNDINMTPSAGKPESPPVAMTPSAGAPELPPVSMSAEEIPPQFLTVGGSPGGGSFSRSNRVPSTPTPIPEPATTLLFGIGLAGLVAMLRRKRK
jgi:hypothetical protein